MLSTPTTTLTPNIIFRLPFTENVVECEVTMGGILRVTISYPAALIGINLLLIGAPRYLSVAE
jgi:hypothetical protein